jgi:hypothetical protein
MQIRPYSVILVLAIAMVVLLGGALASKWHHMRILLNEEIQQVDTSYVADSIVGSEDSSETLVPLRTCFENHVLV